MTINIKVIGTLQKTADGYYRYTYPYITSGAKQKRVHIGVAPADYDSESTEPKSMQAPPFCDSSIWCYRGYIVEAIFEFEPLEEVSFMIKSKILRHDRSVNRMRREIESLERMVQIDASRRERIPDTTRLYVWQRDLGKCVKCESSEKLEFDHIIPVSKGGSNTDRNIQLLCESCNRSKGAEI